MSEAEPDVIVGADGSRVTPLRPATGSAFRRRAGAALFNVVSRRTDRRLEVDQALCLLTQPDRLRLPRVDLAALVENADTTTIRLSRFPRGRWSSPVTDLVSLCRLVSLVRPKHVLEVGSYRGYSAHGVATNLPPDAHLVTVDRHPEHGEAYRGTAEEPKVERRVGEIAPELFPDESGRYDLIFLDADHEFDAVKRDTAIVLPLLSPNGWFIWHDYANWGFYSGVNGVPEFVTERSATLPIAQLSGTNMAVYRPVWETADGRAEWLAAIAASEELTKFRGWRDNAPRP